MTNVPHKIRDLLEISDVDALKCAYNELNRSYHFARGGGSTDEAAMYERHMETIGRLLDIS